LSYIRGQMLAVLDREGIYTELGIPESEQVLRFGLESPAQLLCRALGVRKGRPESTYLAVLPELSEAQLTAPVDPSEFTDGFRQESDYIDGVLSLGWYGFVGLI